MLNHMDIDQRRASERQIEYVKDLLNKHLKEFKKTILKEVFHVDNVKDLTFDQASHIISVLDYRRFNAEIKSKWERIARIAQGQQELF